MDDLVQFLAERYAEEWQAARDRELVTGLDASRETRDIDSKRNLLSLAEAVEGLEQLMLGGVLGTGVKPRTAEAIRRELGRPYSDHPDYDASWAPATR